MSNSACHAFFQRLHGIDLMGESGAMGLLRDTTPAWLPLLAGVSIVRGWERLTLACLNQGLDPDAFIDGPWSERNQSLWQSLPTALPECLPYPQNLWGEDMGALSGSTLLTLALKAAQWPLARTLVEAGASVRLTDDGGWSPLLILASLSPYAPCPVETGPESLEICALASVCLNVGAEAFDPEEDPFRRTMTESDVLCSTPLLCAIRGGNTLLAPLLMDNVPREWWYAPDPGSDVHSPACLLHDGIARALLELAGLEMTTQRQLHTSPLLTTLHLLLDRGWHPPATFQASFSRTPSLSACWPDPMQDREVCALS